jgi:hypothetical protein
MLLLMVECGGRTGGGVASADCLQFEAFGQDARVQTKRGRKGEGGRGLAISFLPSSGGGAGIARRGFQPTWTSRARHLHHATGNHTPPHASSGSLPSQPPATASCYLTAASPLPTRYSAIQTSIPPHLRYPLPSATATSSCCPAKKLRISPRRSYPFGPTLVLCSRHRQQEILAP